MYIYPSDPTEGATFILESSTLIKYPDPPKPVGYWVLPGGTQFHNVKFTAFKRPRWLTQNMMYVIFEWKWENIK